MTEKREWWSDDLIDAVREAVFQCVDRDSGGVFDDALPDVIAAVEDWQAQHEIVSAPAALIDAVQRAAIAETQVRRVREIHQPHRCRMSTRHIDCSIMFGGECSHEGKCQVCREKYPCATICALGGDGDE